VGKIGIKGIEGSGVEGERGRIKGVIVGGGGGFKGNEVEEHGRE